MAAKATAPRLRSLWMREGMTAKEWAASRGMDHDLLKPADRYQFLDLSTFPDMKEPARGIMTYAFWVPGFVKVGRCTHVRRRIGNLQVGNPHEIKIIGVIDGDSERDVHYLLWTSGVARAGEWFEDCLTTRGCLRVMGFAV